MRYIVACVLLVGALALGSGAAVADDDDGVTVRPSPEGSGQHPLDPELNASAERKVPPSKDDSKPSSEQPNTDTPSRTPRIEYKWRPACTQSQQTGQSFCQGVTSCGGPDTSRRNLYARPSGGGGTWELVTSGCGSPGGDAPDPRPQVTPGRVLEEVRTIGLPDVEIQIQPDEATLVNFETIFYTEEPTFERSIDLLGYDVDIEATPTSYTWHAGDGTTWRTGGPGKPYPSKQIVHTYTDAHVTVHPSVDVTYRVTFRVDGGRWRSVGQELTAEGDVADLRVKEAAPVLTS